jgi:anti-sigma regulatory factor (Ser/Thr protein kinase)
MTRALGSDGNGATEDGTVAVIAGGVLDLDVPVRSEAVASVRHAVVDHLAQRGVPSTVIDDIELVTSELVTNAIIHPRPAAGEPAIHVHLVLTDAVEIAVANIGSAGTIPPVAEWRPAPAAAPSGRGLGIVRRLCDHVTVEQRGGRAVITCRRRLPDGGAKP